MDPAVPIIISLFAFALALLAFVYVLRLYRYGKAVRGLCPRRAAHNPVISPLIHREWEEQASFNPTAILDDDGRVHLFYRAIGNDGISRIGYATSMDGRNFEGRSPYPVYQPLHGYGLPEASIKNDPHCYDIEAHPSGGGWGGAEDPRATRIGKRVFMTYTAFEGWENMRIGLTSISIDDLRNRRWKWRHPAIISPAKARAKNWVIFPEKINGKYAILHSVAPKVLVAYVDSIDAVPPIKSSADHGGYGAHDKNREDYWDKTMKGAGAAPMKTDRGWLVLYHAIDENKYKVGAMLLDLNDPTKILYRSPVPILSPDAPYENDGKPGVVYATGAVIKDGNLFIYYGGGDKHVCVAEVGLDELINWLTEYGKV
jgi:predicted GH43/DUF377 family glycosyl hydrolase